MIKRVCFALALLVCLSLAPAIAQDNYPRNSAIDVIHYLISIDLDDSSDEIKATTTILIRFNEDNVKEISLDFSGFEVDFVAQAGSYEPNRINYAREGDKLRIPLKGNNKRGDEYSILVKYHGRPTDGLFIKKNKFGDRTIFADNWPNRAHYWFPSIDHPYDKAKVDFLVTAPATYDVIANGALLTTSALNGSRIWHWREEVPIPVYCMVIGATKFAIKYENAWKGLQLSYYLYSKDFNNGLKDYGRAAQMLEFYANLIGPFPYEKLALVQSSTRFGGMENSSAIFFDENAFNGSGRLEGTVAHEIVHQWFGDSVTEADWHHLWLSESFAQYFGHVFFERADGRDKFVRLMLEDKQAYLDAYGTNPRPIYDPSITNLFDLLNRNNYQKGAWVLHMLRHLMGDEKFFEGIRDYYRSYRDRNALTIDFQRVMERHAGRSLEWFFNEWIFEPGYPVYDATWLWDVNAKQLTLRIRQTQEKTVFQMPLDVEIKLGNTARREVIEMNEREQVFTFKLAAKPTSISIDPDEWVLKVLNLTEAK